jgi:phenylacetaldehyde dehydrogenase
VDSINSSEYGLSGAVWTRDLSMAMSLAKRLRIGNLGINTGVAADRNLPVGGYRQSGWGRENAFDGISAFLETKAVVVAIGD